MSIHSKRGKLKIYLGMCAGVGKTYAMLKDAEEECRRGIDVVAGYIEAHGRAETEGLLPFFERLPTKQIEYKGMTLQEFDLDAALKRRPHTILVDELAHSNPPGLLHEKRWLDVQFMLDEGISVDTTLNIQHLESIAELVSSITGISVSETVPDSILKQADSIEVVDIPPEELIDRLKAGKIYREQKIESALNNFFKEGHLLALREILLRKAAEKIDAEVIRFREARAVKSSWTTSNRIVVAIGANRFGKKLIQKATRIAASRKSELSVVYVQTPDFGAIPRRSQELLDEALEVAQSLGAKIERRYGSDIVGEILQAAVDLNTSLVIVGKPIKQRWKEILLGSLADHLIRRSGNIDVLLVTGEEEDATNRPSLLQNSHPTFWGITYACFMSGLVTGSATLLFPIVETSTIAMLYILGAVMVARSYGRTESIVYSVLAVLAFNFFFIDPVFAFTVHNSAYVFTFLVMLIVSLSISNLVTRIRYQNCIVADREKRALLLYEATRAISSASLPLDIVRATQDSILKLSSLDCAILLVANNSLQQSVSSRTQFEDQTSEAAVAKFVLDKKVSAGNLTEVLPGARALYMPMKTEREIYGVCGIQALSGELDRELLPTFELILQQAATGLERYRLESEALHAKIKIEAEGVRSLVLSSVSHDFRTPITVIEGAAEQIATANISKESSLELAQLIIEHSKRLSRMVNNTLSLIKLEQDEIHLSLEWESLEEIIGQALDKLRTRLSKRQVHVEYAEDVPLVRIDAILFDQLITNILENSLLHAPYATMLEIKVRALQEEVIIEIVDDGPGFRDPSTNFQGLAQDTQSHQGIGLGLRLCRLITKLHCGTFAIVNRKEGGAFTRISIPFSRGDSDQA